VGLAAARLLGLWVPIPPEVMGVCLSVVCCQVEVSVFDHSNRGVQTSVMCLVNVKCRKGEDPVALWVVGSRKAGRIIRITC